ncbi:hypothetical protein BKA70DRAFT_1407270 [Coprinopsis sp. MPI-PUGE-AT-0042]|nr:hypothetical protein BKA70DRAFT_1407270 [Coprinopsis sp. MPI-PUGE-AT-0042]
MALPQPFAISILSTASQRTPHPFFRSVETQIPSTRQGSSASALGQSKTTLAGYFDVYILEGGKMAWTNSPGHLEEPVLEADPCLRIRRTAPGSQTLGLILFQHQDIQTACKARMWCHWDEKTGLDNAGPSSELYFTSNGQFRRQGLAILRAPLCHSPPWLQVVGARHRVLPQSSPCPDTTAPPTSKTIELLERRELRVLEREKHFAQRLKAGGYSSETWTQNVRRVGGNGDTDLGPGPEIALLGNGKPMLDRYE